MTGIEEIRCLDAPLADKLTAYANQLTEAEPQIANVYSALVDRLLAADAGSQAPDIGSELPAFLLPDDEGRLVSSTDLLSAGPLVVSFNRGHWCAFCQLELLALAEIYPEVRRLGGELVSVMPDCAAPVRQFRKSFGIPFRILTDIDNGYALTCGLMVSLGDAIREVYLGVGRDLSEFQRNDACFVPIPATYVVRPDGRIHDRFVHADFSQRMAPDGILESLRKIR
jgi:peroxiredoxin